MHWKRVNPGSSSATQPVGQRGASILFPAVRQVSSLEVDNIRDRFFVGGECGQILAFRRREDQAVWAVYPNQSLASCLPNGPSPVSTIAENSSGKLPSAIQSELDMISGFDPSHAFPVGNDSLLGPHDARLDGSRGAITRVLSAGSSAAAKSSASSSIVEAHDANQAAYSGQLTNIAALQFVNIEEGCVVAVDRNANIICLSASNGDLRWAHRGTTLSS